MKVCRKCKKHVANKSKICKYCGSDVSKARIIKEENKRQSTTTNKNNLTTNKNAQKKTISQDKNNTKEQNEKKPILKKTKTTDNNTTKKQSINNILQKIKAKIKFSKRKKETKKPIKQTEKNTILCDSTTKKIEKITNKQENITEVTITYKKNKRKTKMIITAIVLLFAIVSISIIYNKIYIIINNTYNTIDPTDENQKRIFNLNEKITYKNVNYTVTKVETSQGTKHKHPKEGNEYIIVTVEYENKSDEKIRYSYKDWKMSNSLGEEKSRIFAPVNASNALYTGNLVIGGTKTGSMVFEQPIGDEQLQLHFYEYIEQSDTPAVSIPDENDEIKEEEKTNDPAPIFTIKIPKMSEVK